MSLKRLQIRNACATVLCLLLMSGCTTHSKRIASLRQSFHQGDLQAANDETDRLLSKSKKDQSLIQLEQSLVRLAEGRPEETERLLLDVRNQFVNQEPVVDLSQAASFVLDDQSQTYRPDDYEQLFVLMYLAIANLMQNGDDAYAYSNQITALQARIDRRNSEQISRIKEDKESTDQTSERLAGHTEPSSQTQTTNDQDHATSIHQKIALAPFIAGLLHEQTHRDYDTAERYYRKALEFNPDFGEAMRGLQRVREGHHSEKGNGVLYVFAAVGKGPYKVERAEIPTSQALLIADRILSALGEHTLPPTIAPIKTARVIVPRNEIQSIHVRVNQQQVGETETVTDLGKVAAEQDRAKQDFEMARAVVRRIVKKSAVYLGKDALETVSHSGLDLLINLGGVLWEAAEAADTRSWGLLPEKLQVLRIELPVGTHDIELIPQGSATSEAYHSRVEIRDGRNTYMFGNFPTSRLAGNIIVSSR